MARRAKAVPAPTAATASVIDVTRRAQAAAKVFSGHGSREDAMIVLRDLMLATGYYEVSPFDMPDGQVKFSEGRRSVYRWFVDLIGNEGDFLAVERDARVALREVQPSTED